MVGQDEVMGWRMQVNGSLRIAKQPFKQGVNPPAAPAERRPPKKRKVAHSTPKRSGNGATCNALGGLALPPATAPRRPCCPQHQSPLFEPESQLDQYTQSAVTEQASDLVSGEDDDIEEEERNPQPEVDEVLESKGDSGGIKETDEPGDGAPPAPRLSPFEVADPVVYIRWRACFGDIEKNVIPAAYDTARSKHF
ncbi:hypothetical protein EK21DRAFT_116954 [Setomelanomma holmii]|uniref:Uncharacterized protein n=1 Tax=Setomelanomma holmii TaxID=210430 RepID=A0A9P4GYP1_9PLEO|nr:hypothetical protein EK21DRAFT_116954 [Setomelanomma holmii]